MQISSYSVVFKVVRNIASSSGAHILQSLTVGTLLSFVACDLNIKIN